MSASITIGEPAITVAVRHNARARRMVLRVPRNGAGPTLTVPLHVSDREAHDFVSGQESWLRRQVDATAVGASVGDGTVLPYRDGTITVAMMRGHSIRFEDGMLLVPGPKPALPHQVAAFLHEAARQRCVETAGSFAALVGKRIGRVTLRDTRSRWGSCTSAGDLMFSWRLIMAPDAVLEYVVAHEVAHLVEMNHSPAFWSVVWELCPDHAQPRAWLRKYGSGLFAFAFTADP